MMLKEEITKRGLDLDTINSLSLVGDRTIVLLDKAEEHSTTKSGLLIPLNNIVEGSAGRERAELSKRSHLDKGIVVAIADFAADKLSEQKTDLKPGDRVFISPLVGKNVQSYQFMTKRNQLVAEFEGLVCIPHTFVEAKINDNGNNKEN